MKKIRKIFAVLLSLAMVLGMSMTTFAANTIIGDSDDTATITVNGVEQETGKTITVSAYPILLAKYENNNSSFSGYSNPYGLDVANLVDKDGNIKLTADQVSAIAAGKMSDGSELPAGTVACMNQTAIPLNLEGDAYKADVTPGMYLIIVNGSEAVTYNPAVVSAFYQNKDGQNVISPDEANTVDMAAEGNVWVKRQGAPGIDKTVSDESGDKETDAKGNSVNVGDVLTYKVTIDPIPKYTGEYPVLKIEDTLSAGLTFEEIISVKVYEGDTEKATLVKNTDYAVDLPSTPDNKLTVDFAKDYKYTLNKYSGMKIVVEYTATLNDEAVLAPGANNNSVKLTYTNNSSTIGGEKPTPDKKTYTYTFDIDGTATGTNGIIKKTGVEEYKDALPGATFTLYTCLLYTSDAADE